MNSDHSPGYWAVLPAAVRYAPELPAAAKILYAEISALTGETGYCFATNAYFCGLYKITERTLQNHLRALAALGMISIEDGDGGKGRRKIYAGINPLHNPANFCGVDANPAEICGDTPQKSAGGTIDQDNLSNPPIAPKRGRRENKEAPDWKPERFAGFWKFYPLHKSKQAAIRAWDRLKPSDELLAVIGQALKRQIAEERAKAERQHRPFEWKLYAATFLNDARWEDETEAALPASDAARIEAMRKEADRQWMN